MLQFPDCRSSPPCWEGDVSVLLVLALAFVLPCRKPDVPWYWKLCPVLGFFGCGFCQINFLIDLACLCEVLFPAWGRGQPTLCVGFNIVKPQGVWYWSVSYGPSLQHRAVILNICFYYFLLMIHSILKLCRHLRIQKTNFLKTKPVFWLSYT